MRCTVIGHSSVFFETSGPTILVDPWFSGSCYWRSWWHYPPMGDIDPAWLRPDYLYVTHDHFDHFHYPTIRKLDPATKVLVPRFGVDFMVGEFRRLGFKDVTELKHGRVTTLAPDVRVASYQYGFDDTLFVVADGDHTVIDFNDCKIRGRPLQKVVKQMGEPDLVLKSHSFAQGYPNCYEADDPKDLELVSRQTYFTDFIGTVDELKPRFAVPFASMVGFLHPESRHCNEHIVTPVEVVEAYRAASPTSGTEAITMAPGDTWDSTSGFERADFDWYTDREKYLDECADLAAPAITRSLHEESERTLTFESFSDFFLRFSRAVPRLAARFVIRKPLAFFVDGDAEPYWVMDVRRRKVWRSATAPVDVASIIKVAPGVMVDGIDNLIVHYVHISMRFHTELKRDGTGTDLAFWSVLLFWELGYLPVRRLMRPRMVAVAWRRRAELWSSARSILGGRGSVIDRMSEQMAPKDPAPTS
ncbi:MAG: MBL fold metallo-hydrolase [Actinobacteria bacterium]|nr:MBL fold metallo-hydrolase [Actinomycetota bacterium]